MPELLISAGDLGQRNRKFPLPVSRLGVALLKGKKKWIKKKSSVVRFSRFTKGIPRSSRNLVNFPPDLRSSLYSYSPTNRTIRNDSISIKFIARTPIRKF